ncbi:Alpha/Beta hydrolase protein [Favolaschia claudopus]|uniref:Alpha/Beta hydrolase protein n=1 Tax=Favolaschia claudopus TaxID=2862362 RepID=A0AAW0DVC2_9AGAR
MRFFSHFAGVLSILLVLPSHIGAGTTSIKPPAKFNTIVVNNSPKVELSYLDTGAPPRVTNYPTIFAIHGMIFTNLVFQKLMDLAPSQGVRVVAINRRPFPGSTPFTDAELNVIYTGGSGDAERQTQLDNRGREISNFIVNFITQNRLPPISNDGKTGGAIILGWSVGAPYAMAALSSADSLPLASRVVLAAYLRSVVIYEAAPIAIGLPTPPQNWNPLVDGSIPADLQLEAFGQFITAYFDQNLAPRSLDALEWVITSPSRTPTLYTIAAAGKLDAMQRLGSDAQTDLPMLFNFGNQLLQSYRKAFYDSATAAQFPRMKKSVLCGSKTAGFGPNGFWAMQDDQKVNGPKVSVTYKMMTGTNHIGHWDDPKIVLSAIMDLS